MYDTINISACDLTHKLNEKMIPCQRLFPDKTGKVKLNTKFKSACEVEAERLEQEVCG